MSRPTRVLGVDDNPRNITILRKALGGAYDLATASSGEEALELAPRLHPDIVLLDIMMPGIDGYETCRRLRAIPEARNAKILLVSAKALPSERIAGYQAGADDYVVKPFDPDELAAKVHVYARLRSVEEVDRLRSDLLALLSHETRTPLTAILGPIPLLLVGENLTDEQRQLLEMIESGATRMMRLIEKGSLLAQVRSGAIPTRVEPLSLESLFLSAQMELAQAAEAANVRLRLEGDGSLLVDADEYLMGLAVQALLDNAIRFAPAASTVELRAWEEDGWVGVSVVDAGPGVPAELRPRLFDGFSVADVRYHSRGHGLGLATARAIAELHGGRLWLDESCTSGACFRFELPRSRTARAAA